MLSIFIRELRKDVSENNAVTYVPMGSGLRETRGGKS